MLGSHRTNTLKNRKKEKGNDTDSELNRDLRLGF